MPISWQMFHFSSWQMFHFSSWKKTNYPHPLVDHPVIKHGNDKTPIRNVHEFSQRTWSCPSHLELSSGKKSTESSRISMGHFPNQNHPEPWETPIFFADFPCEPSSHGLLVTPCDHLTGAVGLGHREGAAVGRADDLHPGLQEGQISRAKSREFTGRNGDLTSYNSINLTKMGISLIISR